MKCIFSMQINILYKLIPSFWVCVIRHAQSFQNKKFAYPCNISRKTWGMKLIFCLQINTKVFYKLIVPLWVCVARHVQHTQNDKLAISLQYPKKAWRMKLIFCPQISIKGFSAQFIQYNRFFMSLQYLQKEVSEKVDFLHIDKHGSFHFHKLILWFW